MFDEGIIPLNSLDGKAKKYSYGAGVNYMLNEDIELSLNITRNEIKHDGFDGLVPLFLFLVDLVFHEILSSIVNIFHGLSQNHLSQ